VKKIKPGVFATDENQMYTDENMSFATGHLSLVRARLAFASDK
jgi:hypothetical protein